MALTSLLIATVLTAQAPVKLAHTYTKDTKAVYAIEIKMNGGEATVSGDVTFTSLDTEGNHSVAAPKITLDMGGNTDTREFNTDKIKIDPKGLVEQLEFNETGIALILPTILGYLPASSLESGKSFSVKEKRETYTLEGDGKLVEVKEKDGKQLATIEYKLTIQPTNEPEPGVLTFKSTFDIATGQLITSEGKAEIGSGEASPFTVKKK